MSKGSKPVSDGYEIVVRVLAEIAADKGVLAKTRVEAARLLRDILTSSYF